MSVSAEGVPGGERDRAGHLGFILNATYVAEPDSGRAVVHLYGRLADGRSFLVRDRRQSPTSTSRAAPSSRRGRLA